jgi:hypothetical protein
MSLYVRYQERIVVKKTGVYIMITDSIMSMEEFANTFMNPSSAESLINDMPGSNDAIANPKGWQDNGKCRVTNAPLEHRVLCVCSENTYGETRKRLWECPDNKTLIENYNKACAEYSLTPAKF